MGGNHMRWRMLWRSLSVRNLRVLVVFLALTVGASIICALSSVYFDINIKMSQELRTFGANFYIGPSVGHYLPMSEYDEVVSEAPKGFIVAGSPYLYGTARTELEKIVIVGVNFSALKYLVPYWQVQGQWVGVDFDERNVMIGRKLATRLNVQVGSSLTLVQDGQRLTFNVKGIIDAGDVSDNLLFMNLQVAQDWLEQPDTISHALFSVINAEGEVDAFAQSLTQSHPELTVRPIRKVSSNEGEVLLKIQGLMGLVSIVILLLSTLCVNTSLTAIISERLKEFALEKALGASNKMIMQQVLLETAVITLVAAIVGCILGLVLAQILGQTVFSASIGLRWQVIPITFILSVVTALVAAVIPLRRVMAIQPAKVLKGE